MEAIYTFYFPWLTEKYSRLFLSKPLYHCGSKRDVGHKMSIIIQREQVYYIGKKVYTLVEVCGDSYANADLQNI